MKKIMSCLLFLTFSNSIFAAENPLFTQKLNSINSYKVPQVPISIETVCGTNDLQHVESYDNRYSNLGFSLTMVENASQSVGAIKITNSNTRPGYCSGTLVATNLFLTASHCVGNNSIGHYVAFNYQVNPSTGAVRNQHFFKITGVAEDGAHSNLDYAILILDNSPGTLYGWKNVTNFTSNAALIIQHPNGGPKQVDAGNSAQFIGNTISYATIDTLIGSSGSGVIDNAKRLIGVHTTGGCISNLGKNSGVSMQAILNSSNILTANQVTTISISKSNGGYGLVDVYSNNQKICTVGSGQGICSLNLNTTKTTLTLVAPSFASFGWNANTCDHLTADNQCQLILNGQTKNVTLYVDYD